ncbi:glycyl-radical enzyme activating protein [Eubacteriales bacterium OttesenSCG-928-N13]|nr:glycyl-radical enzyme activating protein [Eubacteriales bacterium OttesenSCG-928-N13]
MVEGTIFGIQRFSIHDGPGIRTTVFFKGCNMRCAWCHNPEGIAALPQLAYIDERCSRCGQCAQLCPGVHSIVHGQHTLRREGCMVCGRCVGVCHTGALRVIGEQVTVDSVMDVVLRDRRYYDQSGGGLTLSGGEPTIQPEFCKKLLMRAKLKGIHTALETNGSAPIQQYIDLMPHVDLFLMDYKLTDPGASELYTGSTNYVASSNIDALGKLGARIILRCPIIPGVNDTDEHFAAIARLSNAHGSILGCELMPYHQLGEGKAQQMGGAEVVSFPVPDPNNVNEWKQRIAQHGGRIYR